MHLPNIAWYISQHRDPKLGPTGLQGCGQLTHGLEFTNFRIGIGRERLIILLEVRLSLQFLFTCSLRHYCDSPVTARSARQYDDDTAWTLR